MIRVLVVDDDKLVRKGLISAMPWSDFGMEVAGEANNGEKALEFLENQPVELLLTDLAMPVMSGVELMRVVRKKYPHIHIVVLTFHQDFEYVQEALRLGAIDYIAKVQLEKERFDEVLGRVAEQIKEREWGSVGAAASAPSRTEGRRSDAGYAFLSLKSGAAQGSPSAIAPLVDWIEAGHQLWLWLPEPVEASADELPRPVLETFRPDAGWGILKLQGIGGLDSKELQAELLAYKEQDFFYDFDPAGGIGVYDPLWIQGERSREPREARLPNLKDRWASREWIHDESVFDQLLMEIKDLRLPKAKLLGFLYTLIDDWNRLGELLGFRRIEPAGQLDYWYEAEANLREVRHVILRSIGNTAYSREVVDAVMKAVKLVHEELDQPVTAAIVARRVGMSRGYFSQCFKDITGRTFNDHVRHVRMERAKEYLICTNKTIAWIAEHTGYTDEKYFSRTFREHVGLLPSEFRSTNLQGQTNVR